VNPTQELVAAVQQERERYVAQDRLARLVSCFRDCCRPATLVDRLARTLRLAPASC
jgi:hypothetical protein